MYLNLNNLEDSSNNKKRFRFNRIKKYFHLTIYRHYGINWAMNYFFKYKKQYVIKQVVNKKK